MISFDVVIPTHGRPDMLAEAVASVERQNYPAHRIVVVLDGPDPGVRERLAGREVTIVEQPPAGPGAARNRGIAACDGEWVCFLDDDDLWHPDHLRRKAEYVRDHPGAKAVQAGYWTFTSAPDLEADLHADDLDGCLASVEGATVQRDLSYLEIRGRSYDLLLERNRTNISSTSVRRETLVRTGGFPTRYTCAEDWVMAIDVARLVEWHTMPANLAFVRRHGSNATTVRSLTNGLETLRAIAAVWADVRFSPPVHRPLRAYGPNYRFVLQGSLWGALRRHRPDLVRSLLQVGWPLLPRWRDRLYAFVPPPVTWRVENRRLR